VLYTTYSGRTVNRGLNMEYCPDCEAAKISQQNRLILKYGIFQCPDCEGELIGDEWYTASKYPNGRVKDWQGLMGSNNVCGVRKINGIWRNRTAIKVS